MTAPRNRPAPGCRAGRPWSSRSSAARPRGAVLIAYPTVQIACATDLRVLVHLVRWTATVVALTATVVGFRSWRAAQAAGGVTPGDHAPDEAAEGKPPNVFATGWRRDAQRAAFLGFGGMLLSATAVFLLVVEDLATWVVDPCISG